MAHDEESTQPIDIEALRGTPSSTTDPPVPEPDDAAAAIPTSSVTRIEIERTSPSTSPSTTRVEAASVSGPHELVQALTAVMETRSERGGGLGETDEHEGLPPALEPDDLEPDDLEEDEDEHDDKNEDEDEVDEVETVANVEDIESVEDVEDVEDVESVEDVEELAETGTGELTAVPAPAEEAGIWSDFEVTSITRPKPAEPVSQAVDTTPNSTTDAGHPADDPDHTNRGHLDPAAVHAVFAAAEHDESTAVLADVQVTPRRVEHAGAQPEEPSAQEPSDANLEEIASDEVESVENIDDIDDDDLDEAADEDDLVRTGEHLPASRTHGELPRPDRSGSLPRFSIGEDVRPEIELPPAEADVVPDDEEDRATGFLQRPPSEPDPATGTEQVAEIQTKVATARREGVSHAPFRPPPPIGKPVVPAFEVDADDDEQQLQREDRYQALLDLYRLRLADADSPSARAALLHKIASVHEYKLGEPEEAFSILVEAFDLRPSDDDLAASLDRVGRELGRIGEVADRARRNLHTADHELKIVLLGHLVYWYERVLNRGADLSPFVSELERLDKTHPIALRRAAQLAAANGDVKSQRELLLRALDRTARRDEKVHLHIALASAHAGTPDAARHYESALSIDPTSIIALQGLERLGREQEKHAQVEWALERQVEGALTAAERIDALVKLADLQETKFLRREKAAEILERVLESEPSHPQALKALERCYHALRDWPRLAKILRARADNTYDKKQKMELLELAAEVFESKIGDAAAAVEIHRDLLLVEPKHRRALADLARLYEKLGDWGNMSTYKARAAELAPSKRQASQLLVQLGDFLAVPERDPIAARLQYERAVAVDPTNAAAWEALQRVVAASGDDRRVIECLEQRARHVDGPRQRAAIYVELAAVHQHRGDERSARKAFESAVQSDPTNEVAAAAMIEVYTREEKWAEAAPLCELLVNAATRDRNEGALFTHLRLSTRIGAALGDADRAMSSALAALDARPDDEAAQADLIAVCVQCRDNPRVVMRAKDQLARIASGTGTLPPAVLVGLAKLQKDAGEVDAAANTLEHALEVAPDEPEVLKELADVYLAQGDFPRCCKLKVDMARNATSADAQFQLLCDAGEIWAKRADELDKAATVFEEARLIKPLDSWLLHTLMWLYSERHRWDDLQSVLESVAQIQETPERKAKSFFAMAQVVLEKVGDRERAADLFDQVLDHDKTRLDAFEALVRALTEIKAWERLERSYRKMIARTRGDGDANLEFVLFQQLGLIYRDRLEDAARAYEAFEAAARINPDDTGVRKIVTELLVVTDNLDNAVARTRELVARDPHDAELYVELYDLFLRQHAFDKAWCAVNVLAQMREPTGEQQRFHEDYAPIPLHEIPGQIVEQAWHSHVLHEKLNRTLTSLFALMTPAVARMRLAQLRPEQLIHVAGRPFTPAHSRLFETIHQTFANAAEILQMPPPELLLGDPSSSMPFASALAPYGAVLVAVPAVEARADSLTYVVGKRLAEQRPELSARAFFPSVSDLTALLAAAVRVSRNEVAKDPAGATLDASLGAVLTPQERDGIRGILMQTIVEGALVDVKRWSQAADLSSMRAGLLLSRDVGPARKMILAEPQSTADLTPREKVGELYKFATSDLYADLRAAIGVAVQG